MAKRSILMTVYKIEANLIDVTRAGTMPGTHFLHGWIRISAQGEGRFHSWLVSTQGKVRIGDEINILVDQDDD